MKPSDQLKAARDIATNPETTCTQAFALNRNGFSVPPLVHAAVRWCAAGACTRVVHSTQTEGVFERLNQLRAYLASGAQKVVADAGVFELHDNGTDEQRAEMWRIAIELAEADEAKS